MKIYNLIPQEEDNWCVPSCLQAIFKFHNLEISQKTIAKNLTPKKNGFCVHDDKIKSFLKKFGFNFLFHFYDERPYEPDIILSDMIQEDNHGIISFNHHAFILSEFQNPNSVFLINPSNASRDKINYYEMTNAMYNTRGGFGLLSKI